MVVVTCIDYSPSTSDILKKYMTYLKCSFVWETKFNLGTCTHINRSFLDQFNKTVHAFLKVFEGLRILKCHN